MVENKVESLYLYKLSSFKFCFLDATATPIGAPVKSDKILGNGYTVH